MKPDFKKLGRKLGKDMKRVAGALAQADPAAVKAGVDGEGYTVDLGDRQVVLTAEDVVVRVDAKGDYEACSNSNAVVALHTELTDDLRAEGLVRELTSKVQGMRKDADLGYTQRISLTLYADEPIKGAVERFGSYLATETLATSLDVADLSSAPSDAVSWDVDGATVSAVMVAN